MAVYKCKNFGSCSRADGREELSLPAGGDNKCPECGFTLESDSESEALGTGGGGQGTRGRIRARLIMAAAAVLLVAGASYGYSVWRSSLSAVLLPDPAADSPGSTAKPPPTDSSVALSPAAPPLTAAPASAAVLAPETNARRTCDEATKANQPNAPQICRRAAAMTLMNAGVQAAIAGNLDQAEKDYVAAKEKDPDFPELYFNFAVLKARQNKATEAIDNLVLAGSKGFTQFSAIKSEPALQKLKSNPELKARIEALEGR